MRHSFERAYAAGVKKAEQAAKEGRFAAEDGVATETAGQASAGHGTIQHNLKDVHDKFQRNFTGEVEDGDGITLHYTEKSAIGHALKTGYGHLKHDGKKGRVYAGDYCYLFEVTQKWGVKVIDIIDHDALNIHQEEAEEVFSHGRPNDNQSTAAQTESGRDGQGDSTDDFLGSETSGRRRSNDGLDGSKPGGDAGRNLQGSKLASQSDHAMGANERAGQPEGKRERRTYEEAKREFLNSPAYILAKKIESLEKARNKAKVGSDRRKELNRQLREAKAEFEKLTNGSRKRAQAQKNTAEGGEVQHSLKIRRRDGSVEELIDARNLTPDQAITYLRQAKSGVLREDTYIPVRKDTPLTIIETARQYEDVDNLSLIMQVDKAKQSMKRKSAAKSAKKHGSNVRPHNLTPEQMVQILASLDNPFSMFYQTNRKDKDGNPKPNNFAILVEYKQDVTEGLVVVEFNPKIDPHSIGKEFGEQRYHTVVTIFEPDVIRDGAEFDIYDELLANPDNIELEIKRRPSDESAYGETLPSTIERTPSGDIVPQPDDSVKQNSLKGVGVTTYEEYLEKYGAMEPGENPARKASVPKKTADGRKVSQTVRTILEAKATPEAAIPTIEEMVAEGTLSYDSLSDKKALEKAEKKFEDGWERTVDSWLGQVRKGKVSKELTAEGWVLYNNAVNKANEAADPQTKKEAMSMAMDILQAMVGHQRNAAQALQATRILKKLNPELKQTYVLLSLMKDGNAVTPVVFEVKEFYEREHGLYLTVALTKIDSAVFNAGVTGETGYVPHLFAESTISIEDVFKNVNPADGEFLKYVPDEFLNGEQKAAKDKAVQRRVAKYGEQARPKHFGKILFKQAKVDANSTRYFFCLLLFRKKKCIIFFEVMFLVHLYS